MPIPIIESITRINNGATSVVVPSGLTNSALIWLGGTHQGTISGVTWGASGLTKIAEGASAFNECGEIWILLNPTPGTQTLTPSMSGGSWYGGSALVVSNIKQTTTVTNIATTVTSGTPSVVFTPPNGNCLILCAMGGEATYSSISSPASGLLIDAFNGQSFEAYMAMAYARKTGMPETCAFNVASGQRFGIAIAGFVEPDLQTNYFNRRRFSVPNGMSTTDFAK